MWTLQSLMDYCRDEHVNIDLFEGCTTPAPIDNELLKSYIMKRCGLLQPIYGEPTLFKMQVKMWYDSNQWRMNHLVKMLLADYEPAENIFEKDHWVEEHSGTDKDGGTQELLHGETHTLSGQDDFTHGETHTLSGQDDFTHGETHTLSGQDDLTHGETHTLSGTDSVEDTTTNTHEVSAYNATTYQADNKDTHGGKIETTYGKTDTASGTDSTAYGKTDTASGTDSTAYGRTDTASGTDSTAYGKTDTASGTDKTTFGKTFTHGEKIEYTRDRNGNVGVKSSSDLMQEELNLLERFNVYDTLASWFEKENMIQVY